MPLNWVVLANGVLVNIGVKKGHRLLKDLLRSLTKGLLPTSLDAFELNLYIVTTKDIRGRVNNSLQPSFFSSHGCIYTKMAVSTSSMILCLLCHVT